MADELIPGGEQGAPGGEAPAPAPDTTSEVNGNPKKDDAPAPGPVVHPGTVKVDKEDLKKTLIELLGKKETQTILPETMSQAQLTSMVKAIAAKIERDEAVRQQKEVQDFVDAVNIEHPELFDEKGPDGGTLKYQIYDPQNPEALLPIDIIAHNVRVALDLISRGRAMGIKEFEQRMGPAAMAKLAPEPMTIDQLQADYNKAKKAKDGEKMQVLILQAREMGLVIDQRQDTQ
jgi:hypothetical protein